MIVMPIRHSVKVYIGKVYRNPACIIFVLFMCSTEPCWVFKISNSQLNYLLYELEMILLHSFESFSSCLRSVVKGNSCKELPIYKEVNFWRPKISPFET